MAGFALPKLRWLVIGAAAAGVWAMTQEVPPRGDHGRKDTARPVAERVERSADARPIDAPSAKAAKTPPTVEPPAEKPSDLVTSSIPRPTKPVAAAETKLVATSRVRLRQKADVSAAVVMTLEQGQAVSQISQNGKWRLVTIAGKKGWVHGDYLAEEKRAAPAPIIAAIPRPKAPITHADAVTRRMENPATVTPVRQTLSPRVDGNADWGAMRPLRPPQGGDCQCPYDLMLNGKQCGDRSAYARRTGEAQCYF